MQSLTPLHPDNAGTIAILLYALHNVLYAAGAYPAGALADRYGKRGFLIGAYVLAVVMNVLLIAAAPSIAILGLVFIIAGASYAAQQTLERAIAADLVPQVVRSTGFGVLASVNGVGDLLSSAIVGVLWSTFSPTVAFSFSLAIAIAGTATMAIVLRRRAG